MAAFSVDAPLITPPRSPLPPLSLHEYRKSTRGDPFPPPPPPAFSESRRIRRKAAAANLSGTPQTQQTSFAPTSADCWSCPSSPLQRYDNIGNRAASATLSHHRTSHLHSFADVIQHYRDQRDRSIQPSRSIDTFFTFDLNESHLQQTPDLIKRTQSLKPHKRLPHPQSYSDPSPEDYLPRQSVSGSYLSSITGHTDASTPTLSLSRFPNPPRNFEPTPPSSSEGIESTVEGRVPKTPTTYHVRDISFEVINPRSSLCLQNIETPAEVETESSDYFNLNEHFSDASPRPQIQMTPIRPSNDDLEDDKKGKSTPPRTVFPNFQSAYNSIRRDQEKMSLKSLPLPPIPLVIREPAQLIDQNRLIQPITIPAVEGLTLPPASGTFFSQRLSRVFHRRKHSTEHASQSHIAGPENPQLVKLNSKSEGNDYNNDDLIISSLPDRRNSNKRNRLQKNPPGIRNTPQPAFPGREYSGSSLIDNYTYDVFDDSGHHLNPDDGVPNSQSHAEWMASAHGQEGPVDSTIGSILEQYNRQYDSLQISEDATHAHGTMDTAIRARNEAFMDSMRSLKPTSSGLSKFEFGFDQGIGIFEEETEKTKTPNDVRLATTRALGGSPGTAPTASLPPDPSFQLQAPKPTFLQRSLTDQSESMSYGSDENTSHLLLIPQQSPSVEVGRATHPQNHVEMFCSSPAPSATTLPQSEPDDQSHNIKSSICISRPATREPSPRRSQSSIDLRIENDLKHLSALSGLSNLSGSIFFLEDSNSLKGNPIVEGATCWDPSPIQTPSSTEDDGKTFLEESSTIAQADCVPVAAFRQRTVVPGIWRLSSADRKLLVKSKHQLEPSCLSLLENGEGESEDETDDLDWETVADSRPGCSSYRIESGGNADYTSYDSLNSSRNITIHPGDSRFQHVYRKHSPHSSEEPVLLPSYDFKGSAGFPYHNALTPPVPSIYNTYKHPHPLQPHPNRLSNSPPQVGTGSPPDRLFFNAFQVESHAQKTRPSLPPFFWPRANLSIVHEATRKTFATSSQRLEHSRETSTGFQSIAPTEFNVVRNPSTAWLSPEPGPTVSVDAESGSSPSNSEAQLHPRMSKPRSSSNAGLIRVLRQGDHRMASSPLDRSNSFAKVSYLGPKANITGTPNGTGMRDAGSSLVGTSSPYFPKSSTSYRSATCTPLLVPGSSPPVIFGGKSSISLDNSRKHAFHSPLVSNPISPLGKYNERLDAQKLKPMATPSSQQSSRKSGHEASKFTSRYHRASVSGQSRLLSITLSPAEQTTHQDTPLQALKEAKSLRYYFKKSGDSPILPLVEPDALMALREGARPRSLRISRTPSSIASSTRSRKQFLSWLCLGFAVLFPPFMLLYGISRLDVVIFSLTAGEIEHFGRRQKMFALFGIPLSLGIWTIIVLLIALH